MAELSLTSSSVLRISGPAERRIQLGEAATGGMPLYKKAADNRYYKAVNTSLEAANVTVIAAGDGAAGQYISAIRPGTRYYHGASNATVGLVYYLGDAAGGIGVLIDVGTGKYVTTLFIAESATIATFQPVVSGIVSA